MENDNQNDDEYNNDNEDQNESGNDEDDYLLNIGSKDKNKDNKENKDEGKTIDKEIRISNKIHILNNKQ